MWLEQESRELHVVFGGIWAGGSSCESASVIGGDTCRRPCVPPRLIES